MKAVFVDTAGWMACADAGDLLHEASLRARAVALRAGQLLLTTDYVVAETLTLIRTRLGTAAAETWWGQIDSSQRLRWERIDEVRFLRAREFFFRHHDKNFSFTDCTSFVVMRELGLTQALTADRHFRQAGFQLLPAGASGSSPEVGAAGRG